MPPRKRSDSEIKAAVVKFVGETKWGFIQYEFLKYAQEQFGVQTFYVPELKNELQSIHYFLSKYGASPEWKELALALLKYRRDSRLLDKGRGGGKRHQRNLKNGRIRNETTFLGENQINSYARLFIEIEEDIGELIKNKIVDFDCGYNVLKILYKSGQPLNSTNIMVKLGYSEKNILNLEIKKQFEDLVINRLGSLKLILMENEQILLAPDVRQAFEYSEQIHKKVLKWPYRTNWILPLRK